MIRWGYSEILPWLLLLIPAWWLVFFLLRRRERLLQQLVDARVLPVLAPNRSPIQIRRRTILWLIALSFACLAFARPQWGFHWQEVKCRGLDIIVVLDTSRSMLAEDIKPNRFQQAKWGVRDLLGKLRGDRIGLIVFAGSSFLECPLTIDYAAFLMTLDDAYVGIIPRGGTAIAQSLRTAIDGFEKSEEADRAIVLITDGEDHEGDPLKLVDELKEKNIRVYAVGVGSLDGELIPTSDAENRPGFVKNASGNVVKTALREDVLSKLAVATGGTYVRSAPGDFGLERVYDQGIAQLKRDEQDSRMTKAYEDRFAWLLGAAFALLILEAVMTDRGRKPREKEA
jgi:Ca-activated chloride channel family protein